MKNHYKNLQSLQKDDNIKGITFHCLKLDILNIYCHLRGQFVEGGQVVVDILVVVGGGGQAVVDTLVVVGGGGQVVVDGQVGQEGQVIGGGKVVVDGQEGQVFWGGQAVVDIFVVVGGGGQVVGVGQVVVDGQVGHDGQFGGGGQVVVGTSIVKGQYCKPELDFLLSFTTKILKNWPFHKRLSIKNFYISINSMNIIEK